MRGLCEDWLKLMCAEVMGIAEFDETAFRERVDHISVHDGTKLTFHLTDGRTETRRWPEKRASHKCPEHQKEHMREVMRDKWTPERRPP